MKKCLGNIVLQAFIVKGILLNNQESEYVLNESIAFAMNNKQYSLILTNGLKMLVDEMWERDEK